MGSIEWDFLSDLKSNSSNLNNSKYNSTITNNENNNNNTGNSSSISNGFYNNNNNYNNASSSKNSNGFNNGYHSNSNIDLLGGSQSNNNSNSSGNSNSNSLNGSTGYSNNSSDIKEDSKFITHILTPQDTLQGLAIKYGVKVDEIKRLNKIWSQDTLFIKKTLLIPRVENDGSDHNSNSNGNSSSSSNTSPISKKSLSSQNILSNGKFNMDHNNMFPEFERMSTSFGTKPKSVLPEYKSFPNNYANDNSSNGSGSFTSIPISTFSMSPVVTSLDEKTQNQFSLLDEEFNPL